VVSFGISNSTLI
jgi:hypothetical protein